MRMRLCTTTLQLKQLYPVKGGGGMVGLEMLRVLGEKRFFFLVLTMVAKVVAKRKNMATTAFSQLGFDFQKIAYSSLIYIYIYIYI